jgi:hypothetical protein
MSIKAAWVTSRDAGLASVSLESEHAEPKFRSLQVTQTRFPDRTSGDQRHSIVIGLVDVDDLRTIKAAIDLYLADNA